LGVAFKISHVYDFIAKLCIQQGEVMQNHHTVIFHNIKQGEAQHRKYKEFNLVAVKPTTVHVIELPLRRGLSRDTT
jgi:hypothetical protein